jgi:GGDEF domain-containing protein
MQVSESTRIKLWALGLSLAVIAAVFLVTSINPFETGLIYLALLAAVVVTGLISNIWGGFAASAIAVFALILINQFIGIYPSENIVVNVASELAVFFIVGPLAGGLSGAIEKAQRQSDQWLALAEQRAVQDEIFGTLTPAWIKIRLDEEILRAKRFDRPLSIALLQLDPISSPASSRNERIAALQALIRIARSAAPSPAVVAHAGGDQVIVILVEHNAESARQIAAQIASRTSTEKYFPPGSNIAEKSLGTPLSQWGQVRVSVVSLDPGLNTSHTLMEKAKSLL